jgi:tetratricopeptide (TPR) repeat protein
MVAILSQTMRIAGFISCVVFALVIVSVDTDSAPPEPFFEGLGSHTRKITTDSPEAQKYFDQGLDFLFGFNHGAAIRAFQAAEKADPTCAMAHWGVALACGPHINFPHVPPAAAELAWKELVLAQENASHVSVVENALIEALGHRYANPQPADRLRELQPGLAHSVHMPSHIDIRLGRWHDAIEGNLKAIAADDHSRAVFGPPQGLIIVYAAHNQHMLAYAAMMTGQSELAVQHIRAMVEGIPLDFVKEHAAIAESFVGLPYEVLIRFGRWDDILAAPDHPDFMPLTRAMRFAARGIALAAKGDLAAAKLEQQAYLAAVTLVPPEETVGPDTRQAILPVVTQMLAGEILYRDSKVDEGLAKLHEAIKAEDALRYSEPPDWILPARHSLGAALMQERRFAEAEQVYRDDLARLPENGWSLFGLAQSLHRQGKEGEAAATDARFQKIWSKADVQIKSSCLCQPGV